MIAAELDLQKPLILELPAVFTAAECAAWIRRIQSAGTELATINTKRGSQVESQIRNNRRVIFDDSEWANQLFEAVKAQVPQEFKGNLRHGSHRKVVSGSLRDRYWTLNGRAGERGIQQLSPKWI